MLFVGAWGQNGFSPSVQEVALAVNSSGSASVERPWIPHPELGTRYVSWVSADGCEVLLGGVTQADIAIATRTPQ